VKGEGARALKGEATTRSQKRDRDDRDRDEEMEEMMLTFLAVCLVRAIVDGVDG
jgi:hypothetical protein